MTKREQVVKVAEKYVAKGRIDSAIKEYLKVLKENPNDVSTLNRLGDLYARISRIDEAVRLFTQIAGQYTDHGDVAFNPHQDLNRKHLDVRGCWGSDFSHFWKAVRIMADPRRSAAWGVLPLRRFTLDTVNDALSHVRTGAAGKALVSPR